jgi:hypothetical protein
LTSEPSQQALPPATIVSGVRTHDFDAAELQHIERQLAGYIGPLAKHLVKTAASRAAGVDDLVDRLAMELDSESERRTFTQRCRIGKSRV